MNFNDKTDAENLLLNTGTVEQKNDKSDIWTAILWLDAFEIFGDIVTQESYDDSNIKCQFISVK